jgi:ABC-type bacteriocin/lantibiotic exporter with double-glycine peptidase domain
VKQVLSLYREVVAALPDGGRRFLWTYSWLLASLAVFDAAALGLLAAILSPVAAGEPATLPGVGELTDVGLVVAMLVVCVVLVLKSVLAVTVTFWATRRIPRYEVAVGSRLLRSYLAAPWRERLRKNSTEITRFTDSGVDAMVNAFIMPGATLLAEVVTLVVVITTLAIVQPVIAIVTLVYLLTLGAILFFWIARRARAAGEVNVANTLRSSRLILEVIAAMKEVTLRKKEGEVADVIAETRNAGSRARARIAFLGELPRYALETGMVGGFLLIGGVGYVLGGTQQAVAAIGLFALAGFRVAPSVIRFQAQVSLMIANAEYPRQILNELAVADVATAAGPDGGEELPHDPGQLEFKNVTFSYEPGAPPALNNVTVTIPLGKFIGIVGASGSGKSTLADLIMGLLEPSTGDVQLDSVPLARVRRAWRNRVGYVPQDVAVVDASIAQNVALTWGEDFDTEQVRLALERADLWDVVAQRPGGMDAQVGERGLALSGGQRQRLGIARALYADPLILVLDEATSALDTQTEANVTGAIGAISGDVTKIVIAHRLATVQGADMLIFMREGSVAGHGRFDELVAQFPDFARQAALAGLSASASRPDASS